jgi:hypothetical protein
MSRNLVDSPLRERTMLVEGIWDSLAANQQALGITPERGTTPRAWLFVRE